MHAKSDEKKRVHRTHVRAATLRKMMRHLQWLIEEKGADVHAVKVYLGKMIAKGRRRKSDLDDKRAAKSGPRKGPAKKRTGRLTKDEHARKLARERARRYRARKKDKETEQ